jgi:ferredoxin-NADP reductase
MLTQPAASSALALVTTVHLAMAALRNHRTPSIAFVSPLALVSLALAVLPWLFPSVVGLTAGILAHIAWFVVCEQFTVLPTQSGPVPHAPEARTGRSAAAATRTRQKPPAPGRPAGFVQTTVLTTIDETPTVRTIRIARPDGFQFEAGQFLTVRVRVDGQDQARCYSISSAPHTQGYLEISVKRLGLVSNALHGLMRPGASMFVKVPLGAFTYPAGDDRPLLLLAGGIGITPLISMLRHGIATDPTRPITLLYSARTEEELAFRDELEFAALRHPQVQICFAATSGNPGPALYPGRLDENLLRTMAPDLASSIALMCGPPQMIEAMRSTLARLGMPAPQIRFELFQAAVAASVGPSATPKGRPAAHHMTCSTSGQRVPVQPGQTLLEAAEAAGVAVPSLCRAGVCGTCRIAVTDGDVFCESSALDDGDRAAGFVFACVSTAQSDCVVRL